MPTLRPLLAAALLAAAAAAAPVPAAPPYPGLDTQGESRLSLGTGFSLALERNGDLVLCHEHEGLHRYRVPALSSGGSDMAFYRYQSTMTADGLILLIGYYRGTFTGADGTPVTREGVKILGDFPGRPGGSLAIASRPETGEWTLNLRSAVGDLPLELEPLPPLQAAQAMPAGPAATPAVEVAPAPQAPQAAPLLAVPVPSGPAPGGPGEPTAAPDGR